MPRKLLQRLQGRSTGSHCRLLHTIVSLVRGCHCRHPGSEIRVCQETFAPRLRWSSDHQVRPKFEFLRKPSVVSRGIIKLSCTRLHTIGPPGTCAVGVLAGIQSWWAWCVRTVRVYTSLQGDCHSRIANSHDGCRQQASAGYDAAALGAVFDMPAARLLAVGGGRCAAWELFGGAILMLRCAHVCLLCLCLVWRCVSSALLHCRRVASRRHTFLSAAVEGLAAYPHPEVGGSHLPGCWRDIHSHRVHLEGGI